MHKRDLMHSSALFLAKSALPHANDKQRDEDYRNENAATKIETNNHKSEQNYNKTKKQQRRRIINRRRLRSNKKEKMLLSNETVIARVRRRSPSTNATKAIIYVIALLALSLRWTLPNCEAFSIRDVIRVSGKRAPSDFVICPAWHPFQCPNGDCIPIKYLCDGSPDCSDEYDEDKRMCTAAVRPPVEETAAFLNALLHAHGADFLTKLFGERARDAMRQIGGVEKVAVAISQSPTIETFGTELGLSAAEVTRLAATLDAIVAGEATELTSDEAGDFRFFVQKLQETGFF